MRLKNKNKEELEFHKTYWTNQHPWFISFNRNNSFMIQDLLFSCTLQQHWLGETKELSPNSESQCRADPRTHGPRQGALSPFLPSKHWVHLLHQLPKILGNEQIPSEFHFSLDYRGAKSPPVLMAFPSTKNR